MKIYKHVIAVIIIYSVSFVTLGSLSFTSSIPEEFLPTQRYKVYEALLIFLSFTEPLERFLVGLLWSFGRSDSEM